MKTTNIRKTYCVMLAAAFTSGMAPVIHAADAATSVAAPDSGIVKNGATANESAIAKWREFGYGMFIHFGMSTFVGNEYGTGKELSTAYAPTALDVDQWVRVAHNAGMKYAVLTAKHVAGHCLWDSKVQFRGKEFDHDVATSGNTTDVVAEFVKACKKYDVAPGLYWCLLDRRNNTDMDSKSLEQAANAKKTKKKAGLNDDFFQLAKDQFAELIQRYPEVGYYWIDIPRAATAAERQEMYDLIKRLRPGTVVLFNHGAGKPGGQMTIATAQAAWPTDVLGTERYPLKPGWFKPEQTWKGKTYHLGYEHCDTIHKRWFWFPNDGPRPAKELYNLYQSVHAGGGNFLLNVPPDNTGRIPEADIKTLMEVKQLIDERAARPNPLTAGAKAAASNVYKNDPTYQAAAAVDDDESTRWATDESAKSAWLEADMGKPVTFSRAVVVQAYPELKRIRKFAVEYCVDGQWKTCCISENPGATYETTFAPVIAQRVRLNITESTGGPTISEFQLFAK